ncbi:MAG: FAD-dependent oxidoreductase [Nitrospinota bacterium]
MVKEKKPVKVIILGAGITGLSAGIRFLEAGCDVCLIEKAKQVGGLAKTVVRENYRLDLGPHHLYSKNEAILNEMLNLFEKDELVPLTLHAKILFYDRFLDYPLTARSVLLQMGLKHAFFGGLSYILMGFRNFFGFHFKQDNFKAWARNHFGDYMFKIFFKPYTEQFWGVPCEELSTDCVPQVTKTSFMKTLKRVFFEKYANESLSIEEVDVGYEKSVNYYPVKGFGAVADKLKNVFISKGGILRLNCDITELAKTDDHTYQINYKNEEEAFSDEATFVISSIPISSLFGILKPTPSDLVKQSAESLKYLSTVILYMVIPDRDILNCGFLYMPDRPYNRISNTNRFHPNLCPEGENMLACEITCSFNDETWKSTDEELFEKCITHLDSDNIIYRNEVKQYFSVRVKNAYPFYRVGYKEDLDAIFKYFESMPNFYLAGRVGAFKYMAIDECMEDAAKLVNQIKSEGSINKA